MEQTASTEQPKSFRLRLPPPLHTKLSDQAWRERKSMNDLVLELVRRHVDPDSVAAE